MTPPTPPLAPDEQLALLRWRLALGSGAEDAAPELGLAGLSAGAAELGLGRPGDVDEALEFVYGDRRGGRGGSRAYLPKWLGLLRDLFPSDTVALVQKDAIDRKGLTELLFEPETLPFLEKNVDLVTTLMSARGLVPEKAKDIARQIIAEVVADLRKALESEVRTSLLGALRRNSTSPMKVARNLDWGRTIRRNLKGWDAANQRLVPERFYFQANQRRRHEWDVVLVVDQSGSMAASVVYSSVMAAIFASLDVLRTRLLVFDTEIVDLTPVLVDPVEVLFATQLGGGTDINRAVAYATEHFVERPEKTLFLLVTDLYEGGNAPELVARMRGLVDAKVKAMVLLALGEGGQPSFDHALAAQMEAVGVPCFGATPRLLVRVMERVMKGQGIGGLVDGAKGADRGTR